MPLKDGTAPDIIRDNIRQEIRAGRHPRQAVAIAYEHARTCALESGDMGRYEALVGADLPADVAKMTEAQALAELTRLDGLMASRGLNQEETRRMTQVELRLEQLSGYVEPEKDWSYYEDLARREAQGEDVFNERAAREAYKGPPAQTIDITVKEAKMGMWPLAIVAALFIFAKKARKKI